MGSAQNQKALQKKANQALNKVNQIANQNKIGGGNGKKFNSQQLLKNLEKQYGKQVQDLINKQANELQKFGKGKGKYGKYGKMAKNINLNTVNKNLGKSRVNIAKNIKNAELKNAFNKLFAEGVKQMNDAAKKNNIKAGKSLFGQEKRKLNQNKGTIAKYQNQLNNQLQNNINKVKI